MDILDVIKNRTSYRGKYKSTPVPKDDLMKILEAGAAAPSGCNKQTTSFIAVDDEKLLGELKSLIVPPIAETAPCFILVLTRTEINASMCRITARLSKICCWRSRRLGTKAAGTRDTSPTMTISRENLPSIWAYPTNTG